VGVLPQKLWAVAEDVEEHLDRGLTFEQIAAVAQSTCLRSSGSQSGSMTLA
jgi:hypothetical protein